MKSQKILYVFNQAPYSNAVGLEGLDAVLVGAAFEQDVSLLFLGDGVFQLKSRQNVSGTPVKQYTKAFLALYDFGIENIFVHDLSMNARGVELTDLLLTAQSITSTQMSDLIAEQYRVFTF